MNKLTILLTLAFAAACKAFAQIIDSSDLNPCSTASTGSVSPEAVDTPVPKPAVTKTKAAAKAPEPTPEPTPVAAATPEPAPEPEVDTGGITAEMIKEKMTPLVQNPEIGKQLIPLLAKFGAKSRSALAPEHFAAFYAELETLSAQL